MRGSEEFKRRLFALLSATIVAALLVAGGIYAGVTILSIGPAYGDIKLIPLSNPVLEAVAEGPYLPQKSIAPQAVKSRAQTSDDSEGFTTVRMRVTAYCPCSKCCGKFADGITANGHKIRAGDNFVAADKHYRFGTELIVPGYNGDKPVRVMDRGGRIKGDRLDVFFPTHEDARQWGVKYLDVKVRM